MVNPENRSEIIANLVADIKKNGNRLTTGDVGNRYLFQALARNGLNELMYTMHNHDEAPGYGFQLKFGATTLTEQWDPRMGSSWNHFMMGQIDEWFFRSLAGFNEFIPLPDSGQELIIRPCPVGDLKYVHASTETLYGKVSIDWKRENGKFIMNVEIPMGNNAKIYMPDSNTPIAVGSGRYKFECLL